jgi:hypothetical protein
MNERLIGITLSLWVVALTGPMDSSQVQDLTDKRAVQDAIVGFGAPHPQPASPGHHILAALPADVVLSWSVSPGTFASGVWTIPGTTTVTASVEDAFGDPITEGELIWETCSGTGNDRTHHPAADCQQKGSARWKPNVVLDPANPTPIRPCFCAGDRQGFRLVYRRGGGRAVAAPPFDLYAESSCPARQSCP